MRLPFPTPLAGLLLCALAALPAAQASSSLFYRAFYEEYALRSFEEADRLYVDFLDSEEAAAADLRRRALLGRGRCLEALGRRDEARDVLAQAQRLDPEDAEVVAALERLAAGSIEDDIDDHIEMAILRLRGGEREQASADLALYGTRAVPALTRSLRSREAGVVSACATMLVELDHELAWSALADALVDPEVLLREPVVDAATRVWWRPAGAAVWMRALQSADPADRATMISMLFARISGQQWAEWQTGLAPVLSLALTDPDPRVRVAALAAATKRDFLQDDAAQGAAFDAFCDALARGLDSEDPDERHLSRSGAWKIRAVFERRRVELVHELESEFDVHEKAIWRSVHAAIFADWLSLDELTRLGNSDYVDLRRGVCSKVLGAIRDGRIAWDPEGRVLAATMVRDWFDDQVRNLPRGYFPKEIGAHPFSREELAGLVHHAYAVGLPGTTRSVDARQMLLEALVETVADADEVLVPLVRSLTTAQHLVDLGDEVGSFGILAPEAMRLLCASESEQVRRRGYSVFAHFVNRRGHVWTGGELPHLFDDVVSEVPGAASVLEAVDDPGLTGAFRARFDAYEGEGRARAAGVLAAVSGLESMLADVEALMAPEDGRRMLAIELVKGARAAMGRNYAHPLWDGLFDLLLERRWPVGALFYGFQLEDVEYERCRRYVLQSLERGVLESPDLVNVLDTLALRDLAVPLQVVVPHLESDSQSVRNAAGRAVQRMREYGLVRRDAASFGFDARAESIAAARENAASEDPRRRRAAAYAIAALGDPDGVALLFALLSDGDPSVSEAALEAMERLGGLEGGGEQDG